VPDAPLSSADLAALLGRFRLRPQDVPTVAVAGQAQLDLAFVRIAALTELLRSADSSDDAARLAGRLLLADLGLVSAWFRGQANETARALARVLDDAAVGD
jgi:hypothetical protein